ncbi:hypothetical protein PENSUB_3931 [Penicillium subrubescens]|uniref:C2H2-type domain-containing protein n=1 Tax=Penicillium subrubescens TaxID=1316194 RepID=A0A1Q5UDS1_9EURO|nr:hypothetical protein PENSUB_3931 [Penicillium subrubescens]
MAGPVDHLREWECDHVLPGTLGCSASNSCQLCPTSPAPSVRMEQQPVFSVISQAYPNPNFYHLASEGGAMGVTTPWRPRIQGRDSNGAMLPNAPHQSIEIRPQEPHNPGYPTHSPSHEKRPPQANTEPGRPRQNPDPHGTATISILYYCRWEGCPYSGTFNRESSLIRHLRKMHITPGAHPCPMPGCTRIYNRADTLSQHLRGVHGMMD